MIRHLLASWRSLRADEALAFVSAALLFGAIDLTSLLEMNVGDELPQVLARHFIVPLVSCAVLVLCWLPAARSSAVHPARRQRLVAATLLGAVLTIAIVYPLADALPWRSLCDIYAAHRGKPRCMTLRWGAVIGDTLWVFMPALMIVGVLELRTVRRRQEQAAQDLLREHSQLRRHALAARLAALQAQVDPALLFDALVSIEQAYDRQDPTASARLDRLIRHLRVALPRLRDAGATLGGEPPAFECELGARAATALPPMLLLPLVQRALRLGPPARCWLRADAAVTLGFDRAGLCADDDELSALRERVAALDAKLHCKSGDGRTEFILELPS